MNQWLEHAIIEPLGSVYFQKALIGATLSAISCGVIGCFVVLRRMAFLGDALSHAMLAGVAAGYLFMQMVFGSEADAAAMIVGAMLAGLFTVAAISFVSQVSRIKEDTAIGIMYTGIFAFGGILVSMFSHRIHIHLYDFIVGMVLAVEDGHLWMIAWVSTLVLSVVVLLFRQLQITTFDPIMAASIGIPVAGMHYLLTACTSLVVVSAVPVVGVILVVGLMITPAATAYLLCDRLRYMVWISPAFGASSVVIGLFLSSWIGNIATGPTIVVVGTLQFLLVLFIAPRYGMLAGWIRRRRMVPQQLVEDILGCMRRSEATTIPISVVMKHVGGGELVHRAIHELKRRELLTVEHDGIALTDKGIHESRKLLRSHRLWEAYLQHVGIPDVRLHETAHQLEHLHDEQTVDYLDDKLGHPLYDPHGSDIPEDFVHLIPGTHVNISLLREGHQAMIANVGQPAIKTGLAKGMQITIGPRRQDGQIWTVNAPDGSMVSLDHNQADSVSVILQ